MIKRIVLSLLVTVTLLAGAVGALFHFGGLKFQQLAQSAGEIPGVQSTLNEASYAAAIEKVKEDRSNMVGGALEIPPELKHYADRHWFLATQVAEVAKYKVQSVQDYVDLASVIERGEMVSVPQVTSTYVLFGVGARADESVFTRFEDGKNIGLYTEAELGGIYRQLDTRRSAVDAEIASLRSQSGSLNKRERSKQNELQKQIASRQNELKSIQDDKSLLDQSYGNPDTRQKLFRDYQSLQNLGKNFAGRSYDLSNPSDRMALKINMLSSLRPEALKILETVAAAYHQQFTRPLPVSSLIRPEQYQHVLRRSNRNAVLIETPPHSTGLAFDIDYRYMSAVEQTFVMKELARLKQEGRIEVIRESNANYHVFAFLNGARPSDELITASLDKATTTPPETNHASAKPAARAKGKSQKTARSKSQKTKARSARSSTSARKHRRR
jgi:hypothetical protein